jgi:hypothetical protein
VRTLSRVMPQLSCTAKSEKISRPNKTGDGS